MNVSLRFVCVSMAAAVACLPTGRAAAAPVPWDRIEAINAVVLDHETPHTKWARPYAGGRIRVLYIGALNGNVNVAPTRSLVELIQRFDVEADAVLVLASKGDAYAVAYEGESGVYGGKPAELRLARLLETPYDCYLIRTHEIAGHIPLPALQTVLEHVRDGAGLVIPELEAYVKIDEHVKIGATASDAVPAALAGLEARAYTLGKGRIVTFKPTVRWNSGNADVRSRIFGLDVSRDTEFALNGRTFLWAAGREPKLQLDVSVGDAPIARGAGRAHDRRGVVGTARRR